MKRENGGIMGVLTQQEANDLINILKLCVNNKISIPANGIQENIDIITRYNSNDSFILCINRKSRNFNKNSFVFRLKKGNINLMRLDLGDTLMHINPDNEKIIGDHIHIYKEGAQMLWAKQLDITNRNLKTNLIYILNKLNVELENLNIEEVVGGF